MILCGDNHWRNPYTRPLWMYSHRIGDYGIKSSVPLNGTLSLSNHKLVTHPPLLLSVRVGQITEVVERARFSNSSTITS